MRRFPRMRLPVLIVLFGLFVTCLPPLILVPEVADAVSGIGQRQAESGLRLIARDTGSQLARNLFVDWGELQRMARFVADGESGAALRQRFDTVKAVNPQYAWIGFADPRGRVLAATDGVLEGQSVQDRPWFTAGLAGPMAGDVHQAVLLQKYLTPEANEPLRLIDLAIPVRRGNAVLGAVGAHVDWNGLRSLMGETMAPRGGNIETMLLARDGTVLVGPAALEGKQLTLRVALAARQGASVTGVETWPDGGEWMTTNVPTVGYRDLPSFGWSVVARQPIEHAFANMQDVAWRILGLGVVAFAVVAVVAVLFALWVGRPLGRIAAAAESAARGGLQAPVPEERSYREVAVLSAALAKLDSLATRRREKTA